MPPYTVSNLAQVRTQRTLDEWFVTRLLVDDGRVQGVVAIELMSGRVEAITVARSSSTAGAAGLPFTTNANIKNGDGMALAYRAGSAEGHGVRSYHPTGTSRSPAS